MGKKLFTSRMCSVLLVLTGGVVALTGCDDTTAQGPQDTSGTKVQQAERPPLPEAPATAPGITTHCVSYTRVGGAEYFVKVGEHIEREPHTPPLRLTVADGEATLTVQNNYILESVEPEGSFTTSPSPGVYKNGAALRMAACVISETEAKKIPTAPRGTTG